MSTIAQSIPTKLIFIGHGSNKIRLGQSLTSTRITPTPTTNLLKLQHKQNFSKPRQNQKIQHFHHQTPQNGSQTRIPKPNLHHHLRRRTIVPLLHRSTLPPSHPPPLLNPAPTTPPSQTPLLHPPFLHDSLLLSPPHLLHGSFWHRLWRNRWTTWYRVNPRSIYRICQTCGFLAWKS